MSFEFRHGSVAASADWKREVVELSCQFIKTGRYSDVFGID